MQTDYRHINRESWNNRLTAHLDSTFYDMPGFLAGNSSLKSIELELLGEVRDQSILHLQCHFGQDSLSLARLGAQVTGVDLSDKAIEKARELARELQFDAQFVCCDLYDLPQHLEGQFDVVFASYGTIGWLPDLTRWAQVIAHFLKPGGKLVFVEFHPVVWLFDDDFKQVKYTYHNSGEIVETESGTYADKAAAITQSYVMWNHGLSEVISALLAQDLQLQSFEEFSYSPYPCFQNTIEFEPGRYRISHLSDKIPMVYSLTAQRPQHG